MKLDLNKPIGTVLVNVITNPLSIENRKIISSIELHNRKAYEVIKIADTSKYIIAKNGEIIESLDFILKANDKITIVPIIAGGGGGGKDVLRVVALVAIAVSAPYLAAGFAGMTAAYVPAGLYGSALSFSILQAGVVIAGGLLVNALFPPEQPDVPSFSSSQNQETKTYSWNGITSNKNQNTPIEIPYGTSFTGGTIINKKIIATGKNSTAYYLISLGYGKQSLDLNGIWINDSNINQYSGIEYKIRNGAYDQSILEWFNGSSYIQDAQRTIKEVNGWEEFTTISTNIDKVSLYISFPQGLVSFDSQGNRANTTVRLQIQIRETGTIDWKDFSSEIGVKILIGTEVFTQKFEIGTWSWTPIYDFDTFIAEKEALGYIVETSVNYYTTGAKGSQTRYRETTIKWYSRDNDFIDFTADTTNALQYTIESDVIANDTQYDIRIRRITTDTDSTTIRDVVQIQAIEEISTETLNYGGISLIAFKIPASEEISGTPKIKIKRTRDDLELNGIFYPSYIPAVAIKDMLKITQTTNENIDTDELESFKDFTLEFGGGGYLNFNGVFDTMTDKWSALQEMAKIGRGKMTLAGTVWTPIWAYKKTPTYIYNSKNILAENNNTTLEISYIDENELANKIEVQFQDEELNGSMNQLNFIDQASVLERGKEVKRTLTLRGATNRAQVELHAKLLYKANAFQRRTVTWKCTSQALVNIPGDVVYVQSDVVSNGIPIRISNVSGTTIIIDSTIDLGVGAYVLQIQKNQTVENYNITESEVSGISEFTINLPLDSSYIGRIGLVGLTSQNLPVEILKIDHDRNFNAVIEALEYNDTILDIDDQNDSINQIIYTGQYETKILNLTAEERLVKRNDGSIVTYIDINWDSNRINSYGIIISSYNEETQKYVQEKIYTGIDTTFYSADASYLIERKDYKIDVYAEGYRNSLSSTTITFLGLTEAPPSVENLSVSESGNNFVLAWQYLKEPVDFKEFIIYENDVEVGRTNSTNYTFFSAGLTNKKISVKAIDTTGNLSDEVYQNIAAQRPSAPISFLINNIQDKDKILTWVHQNQPEDLKGYEIRYTTNGSRQWLDGIKIHEEEIKSSPYRARFAQNQSEYILMIKSIDTAGNYSAETRYISFNQGETIIDNLMEEFDLNAFIGTKTNMTTNGDGDLEVNDTNALMYPYNDSDIFYFSQDSEFFYLQNYEYGSYEERGVATFNGLGIIECGSIGNIGLYWRELYTNLFYAQQDDNNFYSGVDTDLMYSVEDYEYRLYLEPFNIKFGKSYEIKAEFPPQSQRGKITDLRFKIDAPDILETFDDVAISSSNTTITSSKMQYIKNVNITLQDDAGGAITTRILSKANNQAIIAAYNASGTKVDAVADIIVKGFNN